MALLVVSSEKGGSGKSTLACHLAHAFSGAIKAGVVLVDADHTATSRNWYAKRESNGFEPKLVVLPAPDNAFSVINDLCGRYGLVIVDLGARDYQLINKLCLHADLWLCPTGPGINDLESTVSLGEGFERLGARHPKGAIPFHVVLNKISTNSGSNQESEVRNYLETMLPGVSVLESVLHARKAFEDYSLDGRVVAEMAKRDGAKAAAEVAGIYDEVCGLLAA